MDIYEEIVKLRQQGRRGAVATIVNVRGSIPSDGILAGHQLLSSKHIHSGAGVSCHLPLQFVPATTGNFNGLLTLTNNRGASPQKIVLTGTGT